MEVGSRIFLVNLWEAHSAIGGLWHTWFDRDLSIAGRAMVRDSNGGIVSKLIKVDSPILRVPTLAIHLERQENFQFNKVSSS
jgi:aspartyl aminopeptidase